MGEGRCVRNREIEAELKRHLDRVETKFEKQNLRVNNKVPWVKQKIIVNREMRKRKKKQSLSVWVTEREKSEKSEQSLFI